MKRDTGSEKAMESGCTIQIQIERMCPYAMTDIRLCRCDLVWSTWGISNQLLIPIKVPTHPWFPHRYLSVFPWLDLFWGPCGCVFTVFDWRLPKSPVRFGSPVWVRDKLHLYDSYCSWSPVCAASFKISWTWNIVTKAYWLTTLWIFIMCNSISLSAHVSC